MTGRNWLDEMAILWHGETDRRWGETLTIERETLAMVEEALEVSEHLLVGVANIEYRPRRTARLVDRLERCR